MNEYRSIIDEYSLQGYHMYSNIVPESKWGDKDAAEAYLSKYWLPKEEYESQWRARQYHVFIVNTPGLPAPIFHESFDLLCLRGGCLFAEQDFKQLQMCLLALGETTFAVVQNPLSGRDDRLLFRMKFPTNISWSELMSGNFVSAVLFEMPHNEYFVFGSDGRWGKYAANDYQNPLDIVGFKPEHQSIFLGKLKTSPQEEAEIREWSPIEYRNRVLIPHS